LLFCYFALGVFHHIFEPHVLTKIALVMKAKYSDQLTSV